MLCSVEAAATPTYDVQQLKDRLNSEYYNSNIYLNHNSNFMCNKTVDFCQESYLNKISSKNMNSGLCGGPVKFNPKCVVKNFAILSGNKWRQPVSVGLYDTGCSIQAGLVVSKDFTQHMGLVISQSPSDPSVSYTCKLADGSLIKVFGYITELKIRVFDAQNESDLLTFTDVPVFKNLSYPIIFGFSSFFSHGLSIRPTALCGVKLVILEDMTTPMGAKEPRSRALTRSPAVGGKANREPNFLSMTLSPPKQSFRCSQPKNFEALSKPSRPPPVTVLPNSGEPLSEPSLEFNRTMPKLPAKKALPTTSNILSRDGCLNEIEANVALTRATPEPHPYAPPSELELGKLSIELETGEEHQFCLIETGGDYSPTAGAEETDIDTHMVSAENVVSAAPAIDGQAAPADSNNLLTSIFYIMYISSCVSESKGSIHNTNHLFECSSPAALSHKEREAGEGQMKPKIEKICEPKKVSFLNSVSTTKKVESNRAEKMSKSSVKKGPKLPPSLAAGLNPKGTRAKINVRFHTRRVALKGLVTGGAADLALPPCNIDPLTIHTLSLPYTGKVEEPTGPEPSFFLETDIWLKEGALLVPSGTYPRRLRTVRLAISNVSHEPVKFEGAKISGLLACDSHFPDIWIPVSEHLKLVKEQKQSFTEAKKLAQKGEATLAKIEQWISNKKTNVVNLDNFEISANNVKDPIGSSDASPTLKTRHAQFRAVCGELNLSKKAFLVSRGLVKRAEKLIWENLDAFLVPGGAKVGATDTEVELKLKPGSRPVQAKARPLNPLMLQDLKNQLDDWLREGVICESTSEWASPLVPVKKKDGTVRWAVDYRQVNQLLEGDSFPLPNIQHLLDNVAGKLIYSSLDTSQAFLSIKLSSDSRHITSFICPEGAFEFCRLPFGLKVSPSVYSRFIAHALRRVARGDLAIYLDDVLLASDNIDEHFDRLNALFKAHIEAGLLLKPSKTNLFEAEVEFLGHILSKRGIETSPHHVKVITDWGLPRTGKDLASFLGLASYYSTFIPHFSELTAPLHTLKRSETIEQWPAQCEANFYTLRDHFKGPLIRAAPQWDKLSENPFILTTDWSSEAMGYSLSQMQGGAERLIAAAGRKCTKGESHYPSYKGELAALVSAIKRFEPYLSLTKFVVRTDASALKWLATMRSGEAIISRWHQVLAQYSFTVEHVPGKFNVVADALSRSPDLHGPDSAQPEMEADEELFAAILPGEGLKEICTDNQELTEMMSRLPELQEADPTLQIVRKWVVEQSVPPRAQVLGKDLISYARIFKELRLDGQNRLVRSYQNCFLEPKEQFLMPLACFEPLWRAFHMARTAPHPGRDKTLARFKSFCWTPSLAELIEQRSRSCNDCRLRISDTGLHQGAFSRDMGGLPNSCWSIDLVGPITVDSGQKYILSCQDLFSRFLWLEPIPNKKAGTVVRALFRIIKTAGLPARMRTDMGLEFRNAVLQRICREWGIKLTTSVPYFHQSNLVERAHRELNVGLKMLLPSPPDGWTQALAPLLLAYNSQVHKVTGFSPNMLYFGRESFHPLQLQLQTNLPTPLAPAEHLLELKRKGDIIMNRLYHANSRYIKQQAACYRDHPDTFAVGNQVYFVNRHSLPKGVSSRLVYRWAGPATVLEVDGSYLKLKCLDEKQREKVMKLHISLCRLRVRGDRPLAPSHIDMEPEEYTDLLLPPFPDYQRANAEVPGPVFTPKVEDVDDDDNAPPGDGEEPEAVEAAARPYHTRSGRASRPPVRYPADFAMLVEL